MNKKNQIDKTSNTVGLVFGILFFLVIFFGTVIPMGAAPNSKDYIVSARKVPVFEKTSKSSQIGILL